jgi:hypothetical protein
MGQQFVLHLRMEYVELRVELIVEQHLPGHETIYAFRGIFVKWYP